MSRCWAFNADGQRCDLDAGHQDDHQIHLSWTDEEVWDPSQVAEEDPDTEWVPLEGAGQPIDAVELVLPPSRCMVCEHAWHESVCEVRFGPTACGCMTAVA